MATQWERQEQVHLVRWFKYKYPKVLIDATPNPGRMDKKKAAIMKAEGLLTGSPDIRVYKACKGYHGLFIELKIEKTEKHAKGVVSEIQKLRLEQLNEDGYYAVPVWGWPAASKVIDWYLEDESGNTAIK